MILPFLPLYLLDLGAEQTSISLWSGLIFSATFFVSAMMSPFWGRLADKSGKRQMLLRAGFSLASVYLLGAFVTSPLQLFFARLLQGFATGFVPAALALISSSVPEEKIGFSLGLMQAAILTGTITGPLFGGILSHVFGIRASFIVAGIIMFLGTMALKLLVTEPARVEMPATGSVISDVKIVVRNRTLFGILILLFIAQMAVMLLQPLVTLFVAEFHGGLEGAVLTSGIVFCCAGIAGAIAAPLWGKLGQRLGFLKILVSVFTGAGIFISLLFVSGNIWIFGAIQFMVGFFIAGVTPTLNTIAVVNTDSGFRGRMFGLMMSANQFGSMVGPLLGGIISACVGIKLTFLCTGLFLLLLGLVLWGRHRQCETIFDKSVANKHVNEVND